MEAMKLVGNSAIVTGGTKGIGLGIANALMDYGANVVICGTDLEAGAKAQEKLNSEHVGSGVRALFVRCDVSDAQQVKAMVEITISEFGSLHILCNNAGINPPYIRTWDQDEQTWDRVMAVDLKGAFLCTREVIPYWIKANIHGAIVNTASMQYLLPTDGMPHYCAAKAGLVQFTKAVAGEAGRYGIRVNCVAPGLVITEMSRSFAQGAVKDDFKSRMPLYFDDPDKMIQAEDCAQATIFLASNYASWITGETILVDGGNHIRGCNSFYDLAIATGQNNTRQ